MTEKELARKAKAYLSQVLRAEREIRSINARIRHYREMGIGSPGNMQNTPVTHSTGPSTVETAAVGIVDALVALNANLRAYTVIVNDAEKMIDRMPQENFKRILKLRYLSDMSFRSISDEMRYTASNSIYRAHGCALVKFGEVLVKSE